MRLYTRTDILDLTLNVNFHCVTAVQSKAGKRQLCLPLRDQPVYFSVSIFNSTPINTI